MLEPAPIVLFTFNRPVHTETVLKKLALNEGAKQSLLLIYQDGIVDRDGAFQSENYWAVRSLIENFNWPGEKKVITRDQNFGLAKSIIDGVTDVLQKYGKIIVLEDDVVPSEGFIRYMNQSLDFYEANQRVGHVSAYMFPIKQTGLPDVFFYNAATCWGWGTWKSSWQHFEPNPEKLINELTERGLVDEFNLDGGFGFFKMLENNRDGKNDSWAIRWQASLRLNELLSLHPRQSYTQNIGFDGTGVHCSQTVKFLHNELNKAPLKLSEIPLKENLRARKRMRNFYKQKNSLINRIKMKSFNLIKRK